MLNCHNVLIVLSVACEGPKYIHEDKVNGIRNRKYFILCLLRYFGVFWVQLVNLLKNSFTSAAK